ncbi:restriction endonuclease subunit S [Acinetobacter sp. AOR34_HL]|uniref:restriction endonuclease subunit S n=1 Tax=Acinetobacter sp. AOR34_HL TaxID=2919384 RepID=UPI0022EB38D6|nr:restriction endonuclease subunit S [Acinetobacter sp. AOR34_HL]MDA3500677.1 restriction endonuclease subunit S [Acinetobacter sp. AOR34_HL]
MVNTVAKYQKYTEYKKSGVEWLGEIPRHWDSKPLKYLCTYNDEVLPETTAKDAEIQYIDIGSVSAVNGISKIETMIFKDAPSRARRIVRDGDVIVSTVRTYLEAIAPINNPPENLIVSTGFAVIRPNQYLYKSFASYCLRAKGFIKEVVARSVGVSYPAINSSDLVNIAIPSIEYAEQVKIANFLDHETAKIDHLIEKQQQLIELLKEKRQAVISYAVTKGLDSNVPMKDSDVAWLGEVPEHWKILNLRWKINIASGEGISSSEIESEPDFTKRIPVIGGNGIMGFTNKSNTTSALAIGRVGALCGNVHLINYESWITDNALKISQWNDFDSSYLVFLLKAARLNDMANKSAQPLITGEQIKSLRIVIPPLEEQKSIVLKIEGLLRSFDHLVEKAQSAIKLMQERRTALISAAVTGKIDVRNWQAPTLAGAQTELSA